MNLSNHPQIAGGPGRRVAALLLAGAPAPTAGLAAALLLAGAPALLAGGSTLLAGPAGTQETDEDLPLQVRFESPSSGRVVFGPTRVEVSVLPSATPIERVEFFLDGALRGEDREPPYLFEWDAGYDFLSHRLEAVAHPRAGQQARAGMDTARVALRERVKVEAEPHDLVEITFVVTDREGEPARGLDTRHFRLRVDGRDTPIQALAEERHRRERPPSVDEDDTPIRALTEEPRRRGRPLSVVLLLDVSRSMRDLERERFLLACQALLDRMRPSDEMMIVSFSDEYEVRSEFTSDPRVLHDALVSVPRPDRGTDLYGALEEALNRLTGRPGRRVVILYSDGQATVGRSSLTATPYSLDVLDQTRRQPIPVYWIVPHFQDATIVQRTPALRNLALGSGGRWILEREGIEKALIEVGEELESQYYASFYVDKAEHRRPNYRIDLDPINPGFRVQAPQIVSGSGSLVHRLEEMLASARPQERLAAAVQFPRYGYARAFAPLLQRYRREKDAGVRETILAALLAVVREEWREAGARSAPGEDDPRRRLERQLKSLDDPRALALLDTLH